MRQNAQAPEGSANQQAASSLRAPYLEDEAERLFEAYVETFQQAPESDFLIKQYFYSIYFEKQYLQDNVFFIPRENFLWFFKYYLDDEVIEEFASSAWLPCV